MIRSKLVILVERREFVRDCLSSWLKGVCPEFETLAIADIDRCPPVATLGRAVVAILGASAPLLSDTWLHAQIASLQSNMADVPIIIIGEDGGAEATEMLVNKLGVQGYISMSDSMELAAAALRLVFAGGTYFSRIQNRDSQLTQVSSDPPSSEDGAASEAKLTTREQAVLSMLCQGLPNKIIAHRLTMAPGTVKTHIHNIITKLNVRNRTEAALLASRMQPGATGMKL